MKVAVLVLGIIILIAGIGVFVYGYATPVSRTVSTPMTSNVQLPPVSDHPIAQGGTFATGSVQLTAGTHLAGQFSIQNYSTSSGPFFFYILDKPTFVTWGNCSPCDVTAAVNGTASSSGTSTFSWTVPTTGSYFFVYDGEAYKSGSLVSLTGSGSLSTTQTNMVQSSNTAMIYLGAVLTVVGLIVAAFAFVSESPPKPAKPAAAAT